MSGCARQSRQGSEDLDYHGTDISPVKSTDNDGMLFPIGLGSIMKDSAASNGIPVPGLKPLVQP